MTEDETQHPIEARESLELDRYRAEPAGSEQSGRQNPVSSHRSVKAPLMLAVGIGGVFAGLLMLCSGVHLTPSLAVILTSAECVYINYFRLNCK